MDAKHSELRFHALLIQGVSEVELPLVWLIRTRALLSELRASIEFSEVHH
jgi:hypothetical protein